MAPLATAALLALLASSAFAAPAATAVSKRSVARKEVAAIVPKVPTTVLSSVSDIVTPVAVPTTSYVQGPVNQLQAALDFVSGQLLTSTQFSNYIVKDSYVTKHNGVMHVYLRQVVNGLEVINGDINVNVLPDGSILSSGSSFFSGVDAPSSTASNFVGKLSAMEAMQSFSEFIGEELSPRTKGFFSASVGAEEVTLDDNSALIRNVPFAESDVKARRVYIQTSEGVLRLGWELTVEMENNWFYTVVDEVSGEILNVNDWVSQAVPTYRVLPFGVEDPSFGSRELVTKTFNSDASPLGWHDNGATKYTTTIGNNVDTYSKATTSGTARRPDGGANLLFDNAADFTGAPKNYYEAATTQLFHTINRFHDLLYQLGFDEVSGNFQTNNFGKGGKGSDAVIASAQEPSGTNNANFATPADGSAGKMNMFLWTMTTPNRDGDFQQGIVVHEYSHGLSTRLTGGPANSNCLPSGESGGMGEGWGDAIGNVLSQKKSYTRDTKITMGAYVYGNSIGVRKYPYTGDLKVDPETYGYLKKSGYTEVHAIGEVWAGILHEVYWELRESKGFEEDLFSVDVSTQAARNKVKGDVIFLLNIIDGMKAQPCKPNFVQARDAILAADAANFGGANVCTMWKGFAKRGLGLSAKSGGTEAFDLPTNCK